MYNYRMQTQLQLLPPTRAEILSVAKQIESGFSGISINISSKNIAQTNKDLDKTKKLLSDANHEAKGFFDTMSTKFKSFAAYTAASIPILKLVDAIQEATQEVIRYEAELLKLAQITDTSTKYIKQQSSALLNIAQTYNIAIHKVGQLVGTLAQAGLGFREATKAAELISRTTLLATFDDLSSTVDGFIAVMNTFNLTVSQTGRVLDSINSLSKAYAVESSDLIEAVRRTGGAFAAAGGNAEELLSLMTAVRQTTRESAETIATGFRTIFARLQRPQTIEYFRKLGIELETAEGKFAGPYEAIRRISEGLKELDITIGDVKFAEIVEEIGGIRQIQKVIPLLTKYDLIQEAIGKTNASSAESMRDLEKAQEGLGYKLGKLQKEFASLISSLAQSKTLQIVADVFINISSSIIKVTDTLSVFLPMIAGLGAIKLTGLVNSFQKTGSFIPPSMKEKGFASMGFATEGTNKGGLRGDIKHGGEPIREAGKFINEIIKLRSEVRDLGLDMSGVRESLVDLPGGYRGLFVPEQKNGKWTGTNRSRIKISPTLGSTETVAHEFGHAVDWNLGGFKGMSSENPGTFQNRLAEMARENIKNQLIKEGASQQKIDYRISSPELFADFYAKSSKEIRRILASTTDFREGMEKLSEFMSANPRARLFGNIHKDPIVAREIKDKKALDNTKKAEADKVTSILPIDEFSLLEQEVEDLTLEYEKLLKILEITGKGLEEFTAIEKKLLDTTIAVEELKSENLSNINKNARNKKNLSDANKTSQGEIYGPHPEIYGPHQEKYGPHPMYGPPKPPPAISNVTKAFQLLTKTLSENTLSLIIWGQVVAASAKQLGLKVNQDAANTGSSKAILFNTAASEVKPLAKTIFQLGRSLGPAGKPIAQLGAAFFKWAPKIGKGLNILAGIEVVGGILDSLFSINYKEQANQMVQLGDETAAAALAAKSYSQELYRSIPIIGGFLSAFGAGSGAIEENLSLSGKIAVASTKIEASINSLDKKVQSQRTASSRALASGDKEAAITAASRRLSTVESFGRDVGDSKRLLKEKEAGRESFKSMVRGIGAYTGNAPAAELIARYFGGITEGEKELAKRIADGSKEYAKQKTDFIRESQEALDFTTSNIIKNGGDIGDIIKEYEQSLGKGTVKELFGDIAGKTEKQILEQAKADLSKASADVEKSKIERDKQIENGADVDTAQIIVAQAEAEKDLAEQRLNSISSTLTTISVQKMQNKETEIRSAVIRKEIAALKEWNKYSDTIAKSVVSFEEISDALSNIGNGTRSKSRFSSPVGVSNQALSLSPERITRSPELVAEFQNFLDQIGNGDKFKETSGAVSTFDKIAGIDFKKILNQESLRGYKQESADQKESLATVASKDILKQVGGAGGNKQLEHAVLAFTKDILENGEKGSAEAIQKARDELASKQIAEINDAQTLLNQLHEKENRYFQYRIDLVNKESQLARDVYTANREYNGEVIDFVTENQNFISKKSGRLGELESISNQAVALNAKARNSGVAGTNVPGTVNRLASDIRGSVDGLGANSIKPLEEAKLYADQIRDSITYEKQRLDLMKQSAEVLRDYNQALRDAQGDLVTEFAFGTGDQRSELLRTAAYAQQAATDGNLSNVPEELRKDISGFLDRFSDIQLEQFGGQTGAQIKGRISANEALRDRLINSSQVEDFAKKSAKDSVPLDERMKQQIENQVNITTRLMSEEKILRDSLLERESLIIDKFSDAVDRLSEEIQKLGSATVNPNGVEVMGNQEVTVRMPDIQGVISAEVSRMAYSAVSEKFKRISDKLVGVQNPDGIVNAFREEGSV